eukprot:SAG31_NODE_1752_length_7351_cov_29.035852_5_plen_117_part_00
MNGRRAKTGEMLTGQQGMNEETEYADVLNELNADTEPVDTCGKTGDCVFWYAHEYMAIPLLLLPNQYSVLFVGTIGVDTQHRPTVPPASDKRSCTTFVTKTSRDLASNPLRRTCGG